MTSIGNKEILARNLLYYVERSGKSQKELAEVVGVAASTFNDWMKAKKYPRIDKIELLANYFGIQKSDLIEEKLTEEKQKDNKALSRFVARARTDKELSSVVERILNDVEFLSMVKQLNMLDPDRIKGLQTFLKDLQ